MAFVTGPERVESAMVRKAIFEESMREVGLDVPDDCIVTGDHIVESGSQAFKKMMVLSNRPTAVLLFERSDGNGIDESSI
jgi:DNA-binding LacI/PurR family transcriptional regulator